MAGWGTYRALVKHEFDQAREEGRDGDVLAALRREFDAAGDDEATLRGIGDRIQAAPVRADFPYREPSDLESIRAARPANRPSLAPPAYGDDQLLDRLYGAWLGRCCGCALGKPVEGFMGPHNGLSSRQRIRTYLQAIAPSEWPLQYYFPQHSPAEEQTGRVGCYKSTREDIAFMESDDDIRYTVLGQVILLRHGRDFTSYNVAQAWIDRLPYSMVCTAETQAYRNLVIWGGFHWQSDEDRAKRPVDFEWVATNENPYREWIGAQIRADSFGYAAPGNPELAADFAWRDARISHVKNGIYGEMFIAAMIAAGFVLDDPLAVVEAGLAEIPESSRLYAEMRQVIDICQKHGNDFANFEAVLDEVEALLGHYNAVHTNNNAALVVVALLLGGNDFEKVITLSVMGGWDTDCNGATAGSIFGAMHGAAKLPAKWIDPLHDTLHSAIVGYDPIAISDVARKSLEVVHKVNG